MMPQDCPPLPPDESWMATYGDAVTLLMAFFVLLMSFAKVDLEVFDAVSNGIGEHMAKEDRKSDKDHLTKAMKIMMVSEGADQVAKIASDSEGSLTIELDTGAFFKPGSAELAEQAYPFMKALYEELASPLYKQFNINVEGHTDDEPMNSIRYPSNWELSANRAATVVRFVISESKNDTRMDTNGQKYGVEENRLRATGYAHTQPKVPNRDVSGVPIRENRITNRRVVIRINKRTNFNKVKIPKFRRKVKKAEMELDTDTKSAGLIDPPMAPKDSFENKLEQRGLETVQKIKIDEIKAAQLSEVTKQGLDHKGVLSRTNFSMN